MTPPDARAARRRPKGPAEVSTVESYAEAVEALNSGRHCIVRNAFAPEDRNAEVLVALARDRGLNLFIWKSPSPAGLLGGSPRPEGPVP